MTRSNQGDRCKLTRNHYTTRYHDEKALCIMSGCKLIQNRLNTLWGTLSRLPGMVMGIMSFAPSLKTEKENIVAGVAELLSHGFRGRVSSTSGGSEHMLNNRTSKTEK